MHAAPDPPQLDTLDVSGNAVTGWPELKKLPLLEVTSSYSRE